MNNMTSIISSIINISNYFYDLLSKLRYSFNLLNV